MTRDEAIAKFNEYTNGYTADAPHWIDRFADVGMLNLEEPEKPKSVEQRFKEAIYPLSANERHVGFLLHVIDIAGLKIVEK